MLLGAVELRGGRDLRDDRAREFAGFAELAFRLLGGNPLVLIGIKNYRPVLSADVRALAVERRRVMNLPKDFQQLLVRYARWVVLNLDNLGVSGLASANRSIAGIWDGAAGVSDGHIDDSGDLAKTRFDTPEASGGKYRDFVFLCHFCI
jgi:hypothetical protein